MKTTTFHTLLLVLACLLVGAAAADPTAAGPRRLLSTRRLRGGSRQLFGEKFWKKFPTTGGATGLGETLKTTASAYCDRFVEDSEEAAKPLSAKIKAINDQAAAGPKPSEVATLRTQALKIFNDPQLHWIRFDAPKQSGCGATGCMCKPGSHAQEFDDVVIGVRDEVVASLAATPLVCPVVREAVQRVVAGLSTPSDFCRPNGGVHASYKAMAAQACGALGLAANDPLLTGRLKYEWLGRNKAGLDKHSRWMTTGKTCAEQVADSLLIACADAVRDQAPLSAMTREQVGAYISARASACGGGRKHCACIEKTCTPSRGSSKGTAVHYPATGVLDTLGNAEWCFVDDACDTTQVGNGHSCDGAKFAFVDGRIPSWSKDTSPTFAVPHKEGEKYAATFLASGCPVPA